MTIRFDPKLKSGYNSGMVEQSDTQASFEHAVRSAVLAQLTHEDMVGAVADVVLKRLEANEDNMLLHILEQESEGDSSNISADEFLQALDKQAAKL